LFAPRIVAAFVYGSVAKRRDTTRSDIDLMVVSDKLTYADVYGVLEAVGARLGRTISPTVYSRKENCQASEGRQRVRQTRAGAAQGVGDRIRT